MYVQTNRYSILYVLQIYTVVQKNCTLFSAVTVSIFKNSVRFRFLNPKTAVGFGLPGVKVNGAYLICDILLLKQLLPDIVKLLATFAFQRTTHAQVH